MNEELKKLLEWFDNYQITFNEIRLSPCQYIFDLRKFISVQTNSVRKNWENPTFEYDIISLYQLNLNSATVSINRLSDSKLSLWCLGALFDCCISRDKPFHPLTPPSDLRQYAVENRQEIRISQSLY